MRYYELMMVVAPQIEEEEISATLDRVNHYVSERGGVVVRQERWGRQRRLAYPIKNYNEGSYVLTHLEMEPDATQGLEASIVLSRDVLRHLLVKIDAIPEVKEQAPAEAIATDEPATPAEDQATVVEDEPATPAEDQATVVEDEPATPAEDQEPREEKKEESG